jgi:hypothetical protein
MKCDLCGKSLIPGQTFFMGIRHWDCQEAMNEIKEKKLRETLRKASKEALIDQIVKLTKGPFA